MVADIKTQPSRVYHRWRRRVASMWFLFWIRVCIFITNC